jgi:hypothetical protein
MPAIYLQERRFQNFNSELKAAAYNAQGIEAKIPEARPTRHAKH